MKFTKYIIATLSLLAFTAVPAQVIDTVGASNVTAWAAQLHGGYSALDTNETYTLSFAYGKSDGGTNLGSWSYQSGSVIVSGNAAGSYNRTVVELEGTNTYYFRGFASDTNGYLWATQSLSFVTASSVPTNTGRTLFIAVTVDTNGVLVGPTNFFIANGIIPTNDLASLVVQVNSNSATAAALNSSKLEKTAAEAIYFRLRGGVVTGQFRVASNLIAESFAQIQGNGSPTNATQGFYIYRSSGKYWMVPLDVSGASTGASVRLQGMLSTLPGGKGGDLELGGAASYAGGAAGQIILISDLDGGGFTLSNLTLNAATYDPYVLQANQSAGVSRISIDNDLLIQSHGLNTRFEYIGSTGSLVVVYGGSTQAVFNGSSVKFPGQHVHADYIYANGKFLTEIPMVALKLANSYTGGVMSLMTTDGNSFFLK